MCCCGCDLLLQASSKKRKPHDSTVQWSEGNRMIMMLQ
ncbi:hypothetical protein cypCar_00039697 [Cyprinus carpio]|nr:hypothetical protein cypCar_00039697 [Cyprinus carpio]